MRFFSLAILTYILVHFYTIECDSILAIQTKFPVRNGKIYVILNGNGSEIHNLLQMYYVSLPNDPIDILFSIRTIQISNTTCDSIDYSFEANSVTKTGFGLQVALSQTYNIFYYRLVLDYYAQSTLTSSAQLFAYNRYPGSYSDNNGTYFTRSWSWDQNSINVVASNVYATTHAQKCIVKFPTNVFYIFYNQTFLAPTISVHASFLKNVIITSFQIGGIFFNNLNKPFMNNFTQYEFERIIMNLTSSSSNQNISSLPFPNIFISPTSISNNSRVSSKFEFSLRYDPEFQSNSSYNYIQIHPSSILYNTQVMQQFIYIRLHYYGRTNCTSNSLHKLLDKTSQLCYSQCPDEMYETSIYCKNCFNCVDKTKCNNCYSTACSILGTFFNTASLPFKCSICSDKISNCTSCFANQTNVYCLQCETSNNFVLSPNLRQCKQCNSNYFYQSTNQTCQSCPTYCQQCISQISCQSCFQNTTVLSRLQNGLCIPCNKNNSIQIGLPFCTPKTNNSVPTPSNSVQCIMSNYNPQTKQCEPTVIMKAIVNTFTKVASIPSLNMFTQVFSALTNLLDDLSYYTYHGRNYSQQVEIFLHEMTNYTISKFIPFQIDFNLDFWSYGNKILKRDLSKTPDTFKQIDGDIYFLKNTESIWTITLPLSILSFWILFIINWLVNRCFKNNVLKNYNYFGIVFVDLIGANLQYLTFRVFSQLYQPILIDSGCYMNIVICYIVLLSIIIYSLLSFTLFKFHYENFDEQYVLEDIFGQSWAIWFTLSNFIKVFSGFVHSYFYYQPLIQTSLLTIAYFIRLILHSWSLKHMISMFQYAFQFCNFLLMFILQCFFLMQAINVKLSELDQLKFYEYGNMEAIIVVIMICNQIVSIVALSVKRVIVTIKARFNFISRNKYADIKIKKVRQIFPLRKQMKISKQQRKTTIKCQQSQKSFSKFQSNTKRTHIFNKKSECSITQQKSFQRGKKIHLSEYRHTPIYKSNNNQIPQSVSNINKSCVNIQLSQNFLSKKSSKREQQSNYDQIKGSSTSLLPLRAKNKLKNNLKQVGINRQPPKYI